MEERSWQGRGEGILAGETEYKLCIPSTVFPTAMHRRPAPWWCSEDCQGQALEILILWSEPGLIRAKWMSYYYDTNDNIFPHQAKDSYVYSSGRHQKHLDSSLPQQVTSVGNCVTANAKDLSGAVP